MRGLTLILREATKAVPAEYFQLPVAGLENPIYRERVYCYELYHHLRVLWPIDVPYSLSGEVDKSGHPLIRQNGLDQTKPDFLVHVPGDMDGNALVMEVKPVNAQKEGIGKDLRCLTAYRRHGEYRRAILLVYGDLQEEFDRFRMRVRSVIERDEEGSIDLPLIELWYHPVCGHSAEKTEW